jgi:serine/threonine protein kinase
VEPAAIMLEYVYFDFSPFCPDDSPRVHSLEEFLSHLDATDAVASFPSSLQLKIAEDVAKGLEHLHQSGIYHRDLKTYNNNNKLIIYKALFTCDDQKCFIYYNITNVQYGKHHLKSVIKC